MDTPIPEKLADAATEGRGKGLYILSLVHSGSGLQSGAAQRLGEDAHAVFSPDAKWLAYDTVVQGTPGMQVRAMNGPGQWSLGPGCFSAWAPGRRRIYRCQAVEQVAQDLSTPILLCFRPLVARTDLQSTFSWWHHF
jgi:hypothetical protein